MSLRPQRQAHVDPGPSLPAGTMKTPYSGTQHIGETGAQREVVSSLRSRSQSVGQGRAMTQHPWPPSCCCPLTLLSLSLMRMVSCRTEVTEGRPQQTLFLARRAIRRPTHPPQPNSPSFLVPQCELRAGPGVRRNSLGRGPVTRRHWPFPEELGWALSQMSGSLTLD